MKDYALEIEGILCSYLKCHSFEFGVKIDNLEHYNWKVPVAFALGYLYHESDRSEEVKEKIANLMEYNFDDISNENVENIIKKLRDLLEVPLHTL